MNKETFFHIFLQRFQFWETSIFFTPTYFQVFKTDKQTKNLLTIVLSKKWSVLTFLYFCEQNHLGDYVKTQRKVVSLFRDFLESFPPPLLTGLSSKCHNFFAIWSLLNLENYVWQKYSLCLFSKKNFGFVCFHHFFTLLFQKIEFVLPKIAYIGGK